ncbi:MAG: enoyl-CoA hydratase-related protein [Acidimicrobiales bacterium]|jgi:enoyl-CoA hydratase/carnithine racemase|nr:enoyl-CoA hydratase-related protein [Acidimicrobiales bacterium]
MSFTELRYEVEGPIATITLHRPDRMNAFTTTMGVELVEAFDRVDADDDVRAVVVTGAGRAFCAGADLGAGGSAFDAEAEATRLGLELPAEHLYPRDLGGLVTLRIFGCTKPVIAAINGAAVGVGVTMTLPMDIRLAAQGAKIGLVFAARGIVPEAASSWFLPRVMGISNALEWTLTAKVRTAEEAVAAGLLRSVHPAGELLAAARALATDMAEHAAPLSAALTRQLLWRMLGAAHPMEAHRIDSRAVFSLGQGPDAREGVVSFLEKRPPTWSQRPSTDLPAWYPWWDEPDYV